MNTAYNPTHYWLADSCIASDDVVILYLSGKDPGQPRWGGIRRYQLASPDYGFWRWVLEHRDQWPDTVSEEDVSRMRVEFEKNQS